MADQDNSRYIRTTRSAEDYSTKTDIGHVYDIPDTYIGSTEPEDRNEILLDLNTKRFFNSNITLCRGIERLFLEILSNAGDNADASRRAGVNPGKIEIEMNQQTIRIKNGGLSIPVVPAKDNPGKLVPDLIFGELRSSSNYDKSVIRMGCGRNGFGAKLTNIFSKLFCVNVGDNINKKLYQGIWKNNMKEGPQSEVTKYTEKDGFVEITWTLDFERFGIQQYPDEAFFLFARYAADFSLTCKIPVTFNGIELNYQNIRDFASLNWSQEECDKALIHYEWNGFTKENPNGVAPDAITKSTNKEKLVSQASKPEHIPVVEMMILDTPDAGMCLSYVNGLLTIHGGVHTKEAFSAISGKILNIINETAEKKKKKDADYKAPKLTVEDLKRHISIILNCRLPDPTYTSQSKTEVAKPKPHIEIPEKLIKTMETWDLITRLYATLESKMYGALNKSNGGKVKHLALEAGEDANDAGTEQSSKCILYLVEGKSAAAYPKKRIIMMQGGKDFGGYYPLRGKFMNVRNANILHVAENKEVKAIKSLIGLREGLDYSMIENLATLRYGYIMICVDADSDGFHIASLLINYFDKFYPGLLKTGRVGILRTPVVRTFDGRGNIIHRFYNNADFERWQNSEEGKTSNQKVIYYKGLGKSDDDEIKDDLTTAPVVTVIYDDQAENSLNLAFDKSNADKRKEWIAKWREISKVDDIIFEGTGINRTQQITGFINRELIDYTKDALFRAIPSMDDGLKRSHRQALYAALKYFKYGRKNELIGVSRFANYAANETNYHHGETSMCETVIKMAQNYIGSNNIPYFEGKGQFGTRSELGDDAASPRYLSMKLPKYATLLYDEELIEAIPKRVVEGDEVEPLYVPAVVPMHLVNGVIGIATGYSTFIPNHNYYEIIDWCKKRIGNSMLATQTAPLKPWYRGFTGSIEFQIYKSNNSVEPEMKTVGDDEVSQERQEEEIAKKPVNNGLSVMVQGKFKIGIGKEKADLEINEIPIGSSILKYRKWLELLVKDKVISDFRDSSTTEIPKFFIKGYVLKNNPNPEYYKNIHLEKSLSLNNITMIDENGYPYKFNNTIEVLEVYSRKMIQLYENVRQNRLKEIGEKISDLTFRIRFIVLVLEGKIVIFKRKKEDILNDMAKQEPSIPDKYLQSVKLYDCTAEEVQKSYDEIYKLQDLFKATQLLKPEDLWMEKLVKLEDYLKKNGF